MFATNIQVHSELIQDTKPISCRFIAVKWPVRYPRICTRARVLGAIALVWCEAIGFSVVPLIPGRGGYRFKRAICVCTKRLGEDKGNTFSVLYYSLCAVVPLVTVVAAGLAIVVILRRKPSLSTHLKKIRAACVTTLLIVGAYFLCVMPYTISFVVKNREMRVGEGDGGAKSEHSWPLYCEYYC